MKMIFVGNLPPDATEDEISGLFSTHGRVRSIRLVRDVFSGNCRGFGFVEMEGHEARAAISALNGWELRGQRIKVNEERPKERAGGRRR
ncbi:MAG: RNA-binding protein [Candidatus Competibacter sp.]|jgi:RNA recognition motif-containing protein